MAGDRMQRMWAPVQFPSVSLGAGGVMRADCTATLEAALGRELRQWTVTRVVGNVQFTAINEPAEYFYGMRVENENVPLGSIDPEPDATADWIFWAGGIVQASNSWYTRDMINIDNRSQRKSQGEQSKLFVYFENVGAGTLYTTMHARVLLLLP